MRTRRRPRTVRHTPRNSDQVFAKAILQNPDRVVAGQAVLKAILAKIIASRDFAAEGVAPAFQAELVEVVRAGLHEDRNLKFREPD